MTDDGLRDAMVEVSFEVTAVLGTAGAARDLSLTQVRLLGVLRDREPRMAQLAQFLGLDRSSVSGLVDRAAARGLVERFADPDDGRASRVRLTEHGSRLVTEVAGEVGERIDAMLDDLSTRDRASLRRLLRRARRPDDDPEFGSLAALR